MLDREAIQQLIPHRPPFLWLDEVVDSDPESLHARKYVPVDLDVFQGHYPHFPILPGVLLCEAAFQAGAVLIAQHHEVAEGQVPVVTRVNNTRFRRMVRPGDSLDIHVKLTEQLAQAFFLTGRVEVQGQTAVRVEFACTAAAIQDDSA